MFVSSVSCFVLVGCCSVGLEGLEADADVFVSDFESSDSDTESETACE